MCAYAMHRQRGCILLHVLARYCCKAVAWVMDDTRFERPDFDDVVEVVVVIARGVLSAVVSRRLDTITLCVTKHFLLAITFREREMHLYSRVNRCR